MRTMADNSSFYLYKIKEHIKALNSYVELYEEATKGDGISKINQESAYETLVNLNASDRIINVLISSLHPNSKRGGLILPSKPFQELTVEEFIHNYDLNKADDNKLKVWHKYRRFRNFGMVSYYELDQIIEKIKSNNAK